MTEVYLKNSFDRFGDDLTELILSHLSFEQKLSFECVCNRWRNHIFAKDFRFELLRHKFKSGQKQLFIRSYVHQNQTFELEPKLFKSLMKKFFNLSELLIDHNCKCDENVLKTLIDLYHNSFKSLKSLNIRIKEDIDNEVLKEFSQLFGKTLTEVSIAGLSEQRLATVLSFFGQNLTSIDLKQNLRSLLMTNKSKIVSNVPKIEKVFLTNPSTEDFEEFVFKYGQQLRQLNLSFDQHYKHNIKNTLKYVSNLENLKVLRLDSELFFLKPNDLTVSEQHIIDESLKLIGQKCLRLNSVDICIFGDLISEGFLKIFGKYYHCLERLDLALWDIGNKSFQTTNPFGYQPLSQNGKHLTKLNLMFEQLCDQHLEDIHLFLPNLRAVKLNSDEPLTDKCLTHLSKLQNLRTVVLEGNINLNCMPIDKIMEFVANCNRLKILDIEFENDFNEVSYDVFKLMALMTPKINYFISFHDYEDRYKDLCVYANCKNNLHVYKI